MSEYHQPRNSDIEINQSSPKTAFNSPNSPMTNIPSSPASVQGNQQGIPQSPMQMMQIHTAFSNAGATPPPRSSSSMSSNTSYSSSTSSIGTPSPRMINLQNIHHSPMNKKEFVSPAPHARAFGNLSAEDIHPRTPRPTL